MRNYFVFDDIDSRAYGVYISGSGAFNAPTRDYNEISMPGRDGNLLGLEHRLENVNLSYPAFMYADFKENMSNFRNVMLSKIGYKKLIDSYHPDEYRLAYYSGGLNPDVNEFNQAGKFDISFTCMPQRFLRSGDDVITLTANGSIYNPTAFDSRPIIRVYGTGSFIIANITVTIASHSHAYIDIDCDMMDCFYDATNCNSLVTFSGNDFPTLKPENNAIVLTGVAKLEITPRWWRV